MNYKNAFLIQGHLGKESKLTTTGKCYFGNVYHKKMINGKNTILTMAKFKAFGSVKDQLAKISHHTLIEIRGEFAPAEGYEDKSRGIYHQPEMILVVSDVKVLEQPKTRNQLEKEAAQKDAALAAQAAEIAALKAALAAQQGVATSPQQNVVVEAKPEKVELKPVSSEQVGPLVQFEGTKMALNEPGMEDINPMELIPPVGYEEHIASVETQQVVVAPQSQNVAQSTQTKKGLPTLPSFNEIPQGVFNIKMGIKTTESDQPVEYKKECPFA